MSNQSLPEWLTLDANMGRVAKARAEYAKIEARSDVDRAAARKVLKETAADDGLSVISAAEGSFIDLAIHRDTFLDDAAVSRDINSGDMLFWKSRYEPITGVYMGSVYGGPPATLYQTQDYYATLQPFVVDTEEIKVPNMGLTMDPEQLGLRNAGLRRSAEALKLKGEQFLLNTMLNQPLGTAIATSIVNYVSAGNPYAGRTVYVADPGVQSGTFETSNIISLPASAGLSPMLAEAIVSDMLLRKRTPRTIHIPAAGQPWRKLFRYGGVTIAANAPLTGPGNAGLNAITPDAYQEVFNQDFSQGLVLNWFGMALKFKTNNALPQGYGLITTDQPAAEILNVTNGSVSVDWIKDPKSPYFSSHYEKRLWAIAAPDPWVRNFVVLYFGNTGGL